VTAAELAEEAGPVRRARAARAWWAAAPVPATSACGTTARTTSTASPPNSTDGLDW